MRRFMRTLHPVNSERQNRVGSRNPGVGDRLKGIPLLCKRESALANAWDCFSANNYDATRVHSPRKVKAPGKLLDKTTVTRWPL